MTKFKVNDMVFVDQYQGSWDPDNRETIYCFGIVERVNSDNTYQVKPLFNNNCEPDVIDIVLYPCEPYELIPAQDEIKSRIKKLQNLSKKLNNLAF